MNNKRIVDTLNCVFGHYKIVLYQDFEDYKRIYNRDLSYIIENTFYMDYLEDEEGAFFVALDAKRRPIGLFDLSVFSMDYIDYFVNQIDALYNGDRHLISEFYRQFLTEQSSRWDYFGLASFDIAVKYDKEFFDYN